MNHPLVVSFVSELNGNACGARCCRHGDVRHEHEGQTRKEPIGRTFEPKGTSPFVARSPSSAISHQLCWLGGVPY